MLSHVRTYRRKLNLVAHIQYIESDTLLLATCMYVYYHFISLSTAPRVAIVNSACRCVHLPNGGMICDPVGCELV